MSVLTYLSDNALLAKLTQVKPGGQAATEIKKELTKRGVTAPAAPAKKERK